MNLGASLRILVLLGAVGCWSRCQEDSVSPPSATPAAEDGTGSSSEEGVLLHLRELLDDADVASAPVPESAHQKLAWSLPDATNSWSLFSASENPALATIETSDIEDGVRLEFLSTRAFFLLGGIRVELDELHSSDWETVVVKARSKDRFAGVTLAYNLDEEGALPNDRRFFAGADEAPPVFNDGSIQSYAIPMAPRDDGSMPKTLTSLAVLFAAPQPATVELLGVELIPRGAQYQEPAGVRSVSKSGETYDTLFLHAPGEIRFPTPAVDRARLDFAVTTNHEDIHYRVMLERKGSRETLWETTAKKTTEWGQHSVTLHDLDSTTTLVLAAEAEREGAVALWGAPILSSGSSTRPNVIFYVIDGGDADLMSLYDYERPTTPFLEELAAEAVVFTRAHSNSTWTQPSTVSFMTSLHHSVLGGLRRGVHSTSVPTNAVTMAEHFRQGGYQTASFTANPNAGRIIGTHRGMDLMRDTETEHHSTSSVDLQDFYFQFRRDYPGVPYWVHFQTTDVHEPNQPEEPFAGKFISSERRKQANQWTQMIWQSVGAEFGTTDIASFYLRGIERAGIDRLQYFDVKRGLYDETMAHQDHSLEQLVEWLKERGEWDNTILIIGSDHGHPAGTFPRFGRGLLEPQPEPWQGALFDAYATRVPLLFLWPGHIEGGRRIDDPVSMIDVLPTVLDLVGLPPPEFSQGQSLRPLLMGEEMELRPVILDEFRVDELSGEMIGNLEIIDGRWGASLEIGPATAATDPGFGRHSVPAGGRWGAVHPYFEKVPSLLLYDLVEDPYATKAVNDQHPELVERYRRQLEELWEAQQMLAQQFTGSEETLMTPEQLEQLRALGYIR